MDKEQQIKVGDTINYKRNGRYGSYEAEVISIGKSVRILVKSWCGQLLPKPYFANVSKRRIKP